MNNIEQLTAEAVSKLTTDQFTGKPKEFKTVEDEVRNYITEGTAMAMLAFDHADKPSNRKEELKYMSQFAIATADAVYQALYTKGLLKDAR
jgi:hypothetical protein